MKSISSIKNQPKGLLRMHDDLAWAKILRESVIHIKKLQALTTTALFTPTVNLNNP
jgi:hypothetical protein